MAATVAIEELNGSGPTATTVTAIRHQSADRTTVDLTYPVLKPSSSSNYGYIKSLRALASGTFTSLSNWKWYTDGANGYGSGITMNAKALAQGSYAQATGTQGTTGNVMSGGSDAFGYTSAAPLTLTGSISSAGNGTVQLVLLQAIVASTFAGSAGATGSETMSWQYDES